MRKYRSAFIVGGVLSITVILWISSKISQGFIPPVALLLSQLSALLAVTFLALQYFISTRTKLVEDLFDGLDVAYLAHHNMGGMAFILMLVHPMLLLINSLPNVGMFQFYFLPSSLPDYTFGVVALYMYTTLLFITYYSKLPYHLWLLTHKFMSVPLIFVSLHVILISSDIARYMPLRYWIISLVAIAIISALYKTFLYKFLVARYKYAVSKINDIGTITEVYLKPDGSRKLSLMPGQFVFVSFNSEALSKEEHPFSISSVNGDEIRISMKKNGDYTNLAPSLKVGEKATIIGPHGKFGENLEVDHKDLLLIAGGIGVTPFLTMLKSEVKKGKGRKITVLYSISTREESNYIDEIEEIVSGSENIMLFVHISSEKGRLTAERIMKEEYMKEYNRKRTKVFICGPTGMMDLLTNGFVKEGIAPWNIIKEDFNLKQ